MPEIVENQIESKPPRRICRAVGCDQTIEPLYSFCRPHWYQIPPTLQRAIWDSCRPGRLEHFRATLAWIESMANAVEWLAMLEQRPITNRFREAIERRSSASSSA